MVLPILDYNGFFYNFATQANNNKIERLQNKAIRIITKTGRRAPITALKQELQLTTLEHRRTTQLLCLCYHRSRANLSAPQDNTTQLTSRSATRRSSKYNLNVPRPRTECLKRAPCYIGATLWNDLPKDIKEIDSIDSFKPALKRYLLSKTQPN